VRALSKIVATQAADFVKFLSVAGSLKAELCSPLSVNSAPSPNLADISSPKKAATSRRTPKDHHWST